MGAGRDLDRARPNAGLPHPFGDLLYIDGGDLLDREVPKGVRDSFRLEVRSGRTDDLHAAALPELRQELDVAAEIHGARIDEGPDPEITELLQLVDGPRHGVCAHELGSERVEIPTRESDQHVLVNQGPPQILWADEASHGLYGTRCGGHGVILSIRDWETIASVGLASAPRPDKNDDADRLQSVVATPIAFASRRK